MLKKFITSTTTKKQRQAIKLKRSVELTQQKFYGKKNLASEKCNSYCCNFECL